MSFTYALYFGNQQEARLGPLGIPSTLTTVLVAAEPLKLVSVLLTNVTAVPQAVTLWLVPQGDSAGLTNAFLGDVNVPPNDQVNYNELNVPLNHQDTLQIQASDEGVNLFGTISRRNR